MDGELMKISEKKKKKAKNAKYSILLNHATTPQCMQSLWQALYTMLGMH